MAKMAASATMIRPVILSGGSGTRLWPVSRQQFPKQFAQLMDGMTLFEATLKRVANRGRYAAPIIVGNTEHKFFILEELARLNIEDATVLLEPLGRNTAAAALVAALHDEANTNTLHLVMPSDHIVTDEKAFDEAVTHAATAAIAEKIVLFGITPSRPETGYGHIIPGAEIAGGKVRVIQTFREKPDHDGAVTLMKQGALWNSGMFLYAPATLLSEAATLAPKHLTLCREALAGARPHGQCKELADSPYKTLENAPFDTLLMERTKKGGVLPCSMGWSDVGSWQALWEMTDKPENNNVVVGSVVTKDVTSSYIRSEGPVVAVMGMKDVMVIATKDAVLVAPSARSQDVKSLLASVEESHAHLAVGHVKVPRPWGTYEGIAKGQNFLVKHIVVLPGRSLSLQLHHHRAEHWIVVAGTAKTECNGVEKIVYPNESIYIPRGAKHRLSNPGKADLQIIEVQSGDYLGEDDIVRFDDIYGRAPTQ
jgi:mannose-1-phosphate guanylyltransferase / mannose-6-phosphate isomerase